MFAALALASCLFFGDGSTSEADSRLATLSVSDVAIASAIAEARQDFAARYAELGLIGAAPLAGADAASDAAAAARADRARAARREHEAGKREHRTSERSS
jgi:hypothetical protein